MTSEPASHVKPVPKQTFGRASPEAAREAVGEALSNRAQERGHACQLTTTNFKTTGTESMHAAGIPASCYSWFYLSTNESYYH